MRHNPLYDSKLRHTRNRIDDSLELSKIMLLQQQYVVAKRAWDTIYCGFMMSLAPVFRVLGN